jgi:hypothetical protein
VKSKVFDSNESKGRDKPMRTESKLGVFIVVIKECVCSFDVSDVLG